MKQVYKVVTMRCDAPECDNWVEVRYAGEQPPCTQPHACWDCEGGTMQLKAMRVVA